MREVFDGVCIAAVERMLQWRFRRIITPTRLQLIVDLLRRRIDRLRMEVEG